MGQGDAGWRSTAAVLCLLLAACGRPGVAPPEPRLVDTGPCSGVAESAPVVPWSDVHPARVYDCPVEFVTVGPAADAGAPVTETVQRITGRVATLSVEQRTRLMDELQAVPDRPSDSCPASAVVTAPVFLELVDGRTVSVQVPRDGCGAISLRYEQVVDSLAFAEWDLS